MVEKEIDVEGLLSSVDEITSLPASGDKVPSVVPDDSGEDQKDQSVCALSGGGGDVFFDLPPGPMSIDPPAPGIYHNVPFEEYQRWNAINASMIDWGLISMEHMKAYADDLLKKKSRALDFGSAIHCRLLEPKLFKKKYLIAEPCEAILKSGKNKGSACGNSSSFQENGMWLCGTHASDQATPNEHCLTSYEFQAVEAIWAKVLTHPAVNILRSKGGFESSCVFHWNGIRCKFRTDKIVFKTGDIGWWILDVKKVASGRVTDYHCQKSIGEYNYDMRAAWYVDGLRRITGDQDVNFLWVFVEDSFPHSINVIRADDDESDSTSTIATGRKMYETTVSEYLKCLESGKFYGVSYDRGRGEDVIKLGGSPRWKRNKIRDEI